ncbi:MAG: branched-chain amino acid ABC transporter permease [Betaproteobacteria bacterium]|jgi:branched-chain amino acid transport system permease protein|nr:branched-chain amino acid ABC transporter permease [Betaproteobacteria bacterium]
MAVANTAAPGRSSFLRRNAIWWAALVLVVLLPQVARSGTAIAVLNQMCIMVIFSLSYNMLLGQGGMLSFGHAVYFGLGGYFAMHLIQLAGGAGFFMPLPLTPIAGGLAGLFFGLLFGSFSTNRAGTVFAMISLGIGEMIAASSLIFVKFSGGEEGITADRTDLTPFFGHRFGSEVEVYYLIAGWMMLSAWLMYRFSRTPLGRMANAVRDNPERAEFVGYSQRRVRLLSFMAAGFFAGIAGGLFALNYEIVTEETVNLVTSGIVLLQAYIGGVGFFAGPIVGAVVYTLLQTLLSNYTEIWAFYVGLIFVATVMYAPTGLTGIIMMHLPIYRVRKLRTLALPYLKVGVPALCCAIGVIGMLELLHYLSVRAVGQSTKRLFWMSLNVEQPTPWIVFGLLAVGGFFVARRMAPALVAAWEAASAQAQGRGER